MPRKGGAVTLSGADAEAQIAKAHEQAAIAIDHVTLWLTAMEKTADKQSRAYLAALAEYWKAVDERDRAKARYEKLTGLPWTRDRNDTENILSRLLGSFRGK